MAYQTQGERISVELGADLELNRFVHKDTDGTWGYAGADEPVFGVLVAKDTEAAPYTGTVQITGIAQVASDGAGAIDEQDYLASAASGKCKKRAVADGTTPRYWGGVAVSPAAATDGLLVDVLLMPHHASNT